MRILVSLFSVITVFILTGPLVGTLLVVFLFGVFLEGSILDVDFGGLGIVLFFGSLIGLIPAFFASIIDWLIVYYRARYSLKTHARMNVFIGMISGLIVSLFFVVYSLLVVLFYSELKLDTERIISLVCVVGICSLSGAVCGRLINQFALDKLNS